VRAAGGDPVPSAAAPHVASHEQLARLWQAAPDAGTRVAIDVATANARLTSAAWNPFARTPEDQAAIWQQLVAPHGARFADPAALTALVIASDARGVAVLAAGSELLTAQGVIAPSEGVVVWRAGALPESPARAPAPLDARAVLTAHWAADATTAPEAAAARWPMFDAPPVRLEVFSDESVAVTLEGVTLETLSGELGRAQAYASLALGQLRVSAPVELQGGVTLATRWLEALWATVVLDAQPSGARVALPRAACGGAPRTLLAAGTIAGLMSAAQHDAAAAPSPFVAPTASILEGCMPPDAQPVIPRALAALSAMAPQRAEALLLGDALAWVRGMAPSAFGVLPFALPPETVATALGGRPLGMPSLTATAGVAIALHANGTRSAAMPSAMARWLGEGPTFSDSELQLLDAETLLLVPRGTSARDRLLADEAPAWVALVDALPPDTTGVLALSRASFLPVLQGPVADAGPLGQALADAEVVAFYRRATGGLGLAVWPVEAGIDPAELAADWPDWWVRRARATGAQSAANEARLLAFSSAMAGTVEVAHTGATLRVEAASAMPWLRAAIEIGIPALAEQITRGRITPPANLPVFRPGVGR
jgi:hypothetical protein